MAEHADRLAARLRTLREHAGTPTYEAIKAHGRKQHPPVKFPAPTLNGWLAGTAVPADERSFMVLVAWLEFRAKEHPDHQTLGVAQWEALRSAAWRESHPGRRPSADPDAAIGTPSLPSLGRLIGSWNPLDLEVHPAGGSTGRDDVPRLPAYVRRAHDEALAAVVARAAAGHSAMAVLIGSSSTGKTRACWEAIQPLAELGWRLWHPFDPTCADAALADLEHVGPRTVVWLNETQHYLNAGEPVAAALHTLLTDQDRGPVLVLGTLWPDYDRIYAALPEPGKADPFARARQLLEGRRITVPEVFDQAALDRARCAADAGDQLLAVALADVHGGRIAQHLAGAPQLLYRYETASPAGRALLDAAADARRLGAGPHLPLGFLVDAVVDYLDRDEADALTDDWQRLALAELAAPVHGNFAPLRPTRPGTPTGVPQAPAGVAERVGLLYRLADYLEQHGRLTRWTLCPPASFWLAAHTHLTDPGDLARLSDAAGCRLRLYWQHALAQRAADAGNGEPLFQMAGMRRMVGDEQGAQVLYQCAAEAGNAEALAILARQRELAQDQMGAQALYRRAAEAMKTAGGVGAVVALARRQVADVLYQCAADAGDTTAMVELARRRGWARDRMGAEVLYQRAADAGNVLAMVELAHQRKRAGDLLGTERAAQRAADATDGRDARILFHLIQLPWMDGAWRHALYQRVIEAADAGITEAVVELAERAWDQRDAEVLYQRAADAGNTDVLSRLAGLRERAGDRLGAERAAQRAADAGDTKVLVHLAELRERAVDRQGVKRAAQPPADSVDLAHDKAKLLFRLAQSSELNADWPHAQALYQRAADAGHNAAAVELVRLRQWIADRQLDAEVLYQRAADAGNTDVLSRLAGLRERAGDRLGAERAAQRAADAGDTKVLVHLAVLRKSADPRSAELLAQRAADAGNATAMAVLAELQERAGDLHKAVTLCLRALDAGASSAQFDLARMWGRDGQGGAKGAADALRRSDVLRYGLQPDGTPSPPWHPGT